MFKPNDKKNYLISGIFISVLLVVVVATVFMLNKENALFSSDIVLRTEVKNAQNLKPGAAIQLRGIKVGSVKDIQIKDLETISIFFKVSEEYSPWVKEDSEIQFKTQGVLGDKFLEITGGSLDSKSIKDGGYLIANENSKIDHIITKSEDLLLVAGNILTKFDKMIDAVESNKFSKILNNLDTLTNNAGQVMGTLNRSNLSQSITELHQSTASLSKITTQIEKGPGSLNSIIYDQGLYEDLRSLLGGANRSKVLKFFIRESIKKNEDQSK